MRKTKSFLFSTLWKKRLNEGMPASLALYYIRQYLPILSKAIDEGRYIRLVLFKLFNENPKFLYFYLDKYWGDIYQITRPVDLARPGEYDQKVKEAQVQIERVKKLMEKCLENEF